jgi:hypothetical protein
MQVSVDIDRELLEKAMLLSRSQDISELLQQALQAFIYTLPQSKEMSAIDKERQALLAEIFAIAEQCAALPNVDTRPESEILGYNQRGLFNGD